MEARLGEHGSEQLQHEQFKQNTQTHTQTQVGAAFALPRPTAGIRSARRRAHSFMCANRAEVSYRLC